MLRLKGLPLNPRKILCKYFVLVTFFCFSIANRCAKLLTVYFINNSYHWLNFGREYSFINIIWRLLCRFSCDQHVVCDHSSQSNNDNNSTITINKIFYCKYWVQIKSYLESEGIKLGKLKELKVSYVNVN
jgi:hypothetical protein